MIEYVNSLTYRISFFFWEQSLSSVPLFLFVLLLTLLFRQKFTNTFYALWFIFLVRLVIPVKYLLSGLYNSADPVSVLRVIQVRLQPADTFGAISGFQNIAEPKLSFVSYLVFAWFAIFLLLLLRYLYSHVRVQQIESQAATAHQPHVLSCLEKWKSKLGIRRTIMAHFSNDTVTAFNSGFFKPQIILPASYINMHVKKLDIILGHECIHIKRADNMKLFLQQLILMVFFFNPLVWIGSKMLSLHREQICDASILNAAKISRKFYGNILLDSNRQPGLAGISTGFNINYLTIKSRLLSLNRSQPMKKPGIFLVLLSTMLLFAFNTGTTAESLENKDMEKQNINFTAPVKTGRISSHFGKRLHPIKKIELQHDGIDVACKKGTPVYAVADGQVIFAANKGKTSYGNLIILNHAAGYQTRYAQLSKIKVEKDAQIAKGQLIGLVGSSGVSTAPHLHFELRKDGEPMDPKDYISFDLK